jgi:Transglutaminase-like superfamily
MRLARARSTLLILFVALAPSPRAARATGPGPVLHERIRPDSAEDARLGLAVDGDLPAALNTPSGVVSAPDPHRPPSASGSGRSLDSALTSAAPNARFHPDRDTHRPDVVPYDDPFTPSTAPFKRLLAFDVVDSSYTLSVRDPRLVPLAPRTPAAADGTDDSFFADLVVDLVPDRPVRIPSVGPGAKIVRAHAGVGSTDVSVRFLHDTADNWFVVGDVSTRARLVMELAIARASFGGAFAEPSWSDLPKASPLPANVARAAAEVAARIGVSRGLSPRDAVAKLVAYFRSFADSDEFPTDRDDVYLALALSKKGVCRHRAFAFLVTALGLGLPTRMIANEAHAWVEVNDGSLWRRIDLGGAGRAMDAALAGGVKHDAPPDPFAWPPNATRGDDLADRARTATASPGGQGGGESAKNAAAAASSASESHDSFGGPADDRPSSRVSLSIDDSSARRGGSLRVHGDVSAEGAACGHVLVDLGLRDGRGLDLRLGTLATDDEGKYDGTLMIPSAIPLGDYDLSARTSGDSRCGRGAGP